MDIYTRIKLRREQLNISQTDLAEHLGYTNRSSIAKIESGKNDLPQSRINAFAKELQTTPAWLMGWTDDPYDYDRDLEGIVKQVPSSVWERLVSLTHGDLRSAYAIWFQIRHSTTAEDAANTLPQYSAGEIHSIFHLDWNEELGKYIIGGITVSDTDPQIDELSDICATLTAAGIQRVIEYAEDLTHNPKYQRKKPT